MLQSVSEAERNQKRSEASEPIRFGPLFLFLNTNRVGGAEPPLTPPQQHGAPTAALRACRLHQCTINEKIKNASIYYLS